MTRAVTMSCKLHCLTSLGLTMCFAWCVVFVWLAANGRVAGLHSGNSIYTIQPVNNRQQSHSTPYYINKAQNYIINPTDDTFRHAEPTQAVPVAKTAQVYVLNSRPNYILTQGGQGETATVQTATKYSSKQYKEGEYVYPISLEGDTVGGNHGKEREISPTGGDSAKEPLSGRDQDPFSFLRNTRYDQGGQGPERQVYNPNGIGYTQQQQQQQQQQQYAGQKYPENGQFQSSNPGLPHSLDSPRHFSPNGFPFGTGADIFNDGIRQPSVSDDVIRVTDCAMLEEADSDVTGRTHCLVDKSCFNMRMRKQCEGHDLIRAADGTCNNRQHPLWGAAFQPFKRYLPPAYDDGRGAPRKWSQEKDSQGRPLPLPSPRLVSRTVHLITDAPSEVSGLLMQFGQFVDHDITGTSGTRGTSGTIRCCDQSAPPLHEACLPIDIPPGDTHFTDSSCINFVRSLAAVDHNKVTLVPRQQRNEVTSYLDGSVVYGSSEDHTRELRSFQGGELRSSADDMLPLATDGSCMADDKMCLTSGDSRVNEVPGLGALHVIFHRQHNLLARQLAAILPSDFAAPPGVLDEAIFQTARKIVGAQLQHVVYTEWLPLVLGPFAMNHDGLTRRGHTYDANRDPRVANVFATAAFRFGHSMVPDWLAVGDERIPLHSTFSDPKLVRHKLDLLLSGLLQSVAQTRDQYFVASIRNRLFELAPRRGLDLVALNIQRGRDHGLPAYQAWRTVCGLRTVQGFNDSALGTAGPALREVYMSVDDIDLFTGAMCERPLDGALVGETLACLIGQQFADLKYGDRFFYETSGPEGFTEGQLQFIHHTTMAGLLCTNTNSINSLQANAFLKPSAQNPSVPCSQWKSPVSLAAWRDDLLRLAHGLLGR